MIVLKLIHVLLMQLTMLGNQLGHDLVRAENREYHELLLRSA